MLDLFLATAHHLAAFALVGLLVAQAALLHPKLEPTAVVRLARLDVVYGLCAMTMLGIGLARVLLAAKGWEYYALNGAFWLKMAVFMGIGALSLSPTLAFRRWRRAETPPSVAEVEGVRRFIRAELALVPLLPLLAAAMARGMLQVGI